MRPVCIFLPISRSEHLDMVFTGLEMLSCNASLTYLVTYVDGNDELYERARRLTIGSKFNLKLCERRPYQAPTHNRVDRIARIAAIKNESRDLIPKGAAFVFGIEDDTVIPPHALQTLLDDYAAHPQAGFIQGVELGRHGWPYVGAWRADDAWEPTTITSAMPPLEARVEEIDAGGFYCYLTRAHLYKQWTYKPFDQHAAGADVEWGLQLRSEGYRNYVDWRVRCDHRVYLGKLLSFGNTQPVQSQLYERDGKWHSKKL